MRIFLINSHKFSQNSHKILTTKLLFIIYLSQFLRENEKNESTFLNSQISHNLLKSQIGIWLNTNFVTTKLKKSENSYGFPIETFGNDKKRDGQDDYQTSEGISNGHFATYYWDL